MLLFPYISPSPSSPPTMSIGLFPMSVSPFLPWKQIHQCHLFGTCFPCSSVGKESACNAGDPGSIPGSGGCPGEGNDNSLQYSCLEHPMDKGAWQATVHGFTRVGHDWATKPPARNRLASHYKKPSTSLIWNANKHHYFLYEIILNVTHFYPLFCLLWFPHIPVRVKLVDYVL